MTSIMKGWHTCESLFESLESLDRWYANNIYLAAGFWPSTWPSRYEFINTMNYFMHCSNLIQFFALSVLLFIFLCNSGSRAVHMLMHIGAPLGFPLSLARAGHIASEDAETKGSPMGMILYIVCSSSFRDARV